MDHRPSFAIVLVAVVVLAGCSGGIPFTDDSSSANETTTDSVATTQPPATDTRTTREPTPTPTTATTGEPTPTPTPTNTEQPSTVTTTTSATQTATTTSTTAVNGTEANSVTFPPGYSASGITNPKRAFENHLSEFFSLESFTHSGEFFLVKPGIRVSFISHVNVAEKQAYSVIDKPKVSEYTKVSSYITGNTYYVATFSNKSVVEYRVGHTPFKSVMSSYIRSNLYNRILELFKYVEYGDAERITRGGEVLLRYESTKPLNATKLVPVTALKFPANTTKLNATINAFNATVLVDTDGLIHLATYSVTYTKPGGKRVTTNRTFRVTHINTTTVEKPAWLDEAKAQTDQSTAEFRPITTTETAAAVESPADVTSYPYTPAQAEIVRYCE